MLDIFLLSPSISSCTSHFLTVAMVLPLSPLLHFSYLKLLEVCALLILLDPSTTLTLDLLL